MDDYAKGMVIVLGPEDGESFWQPLPSTGYVINKINPYNSPYDAFSTGLQVLEPGAHVRRHAHERSHELLFCYRGSGQADIEGKLYDVRAGNHDPDRPGIAAQGDEHRRRPDAPPLVHCAGGSGGLVPRHRASAACGRTNGRRRSSARPTSQPSRRNSASSGRTRTERGRPT